MSLLFAEIVWERVASLEKSGPQHPDVSASLALSDEHVALQVK